VTSRSALLSRLAGAIARDAARHPLPWRACHAVRDLLGADGAAVTIRLPGGDRLSLCATGDRSQRLADLHEELGEGPAIDACGAGQPQVTGLDRLAAARWPRFIPAAARVIGRRGMLWSLPMDPAGQVMGAISLHRLAAGSLAEPLPAARFVVNATAVTLLRDPFVGRVLRSAG
jgi:hypothetical protein